MNIIGLIPARSGSKGVINKNMRMIGGHTLIEWSINACLRSKLINRVIVSTDSKQYAEHSEKAGAEAPFTRPKEISSDLSTDFEFIDHAINWLENHNDSPDYIVHVRPTTPFRDPAIIDKAIKIFQFSNIASALRSVHEMPESAYKTFEINHEGRLKRICSNETSLDISNNARQEFPKTFSANGYVDVLSVDFIKKNKAIHGDHVLPFITPFTDEIDTEDDMDRLEIKLSQYPELGTKIFK